MLLKRFLPIKTQKNAEYNNRRLKFIECNASLDAISQQIIVALKNNLHQSKAGFMCIRELEIMAKII